MAFEVFFARWRDGEPVQFESDPVRQVFERYGISDFQSQYFNLPSGQSVELHASFEEDYDTGFSVLFRSVSNELFQLICDLCGIRLVGMIVDTPFIPLVSEVEDGLQFEPPDYAAAVICKSREDVERALFPQFKHWHDWAFRPR